MSQDAIIVEQMKQLKILTNHIKAAQSQIKKMKTAKAQIEDRIMNYLNSTNRSGAKTNDLLILTKEKTTRGKKKKDEKEQDVIQVLQSAGIRNADETYQQIIQALQGEQHKSTTLVIKEPNKKK
jgi:hypothetical protein